MSERADKFPRATIKGNAWPIDLPPGARRRPLWKRLKAKLMRRLGRKEEDPNGR